MFGWFLTGFLLGSCIAAIIVWVVPKHTHNNKGYQPEDSVDADEAQPPLGAGSAAQPPRNRQPPFPEEE